MIVKYSDGDNPELAKQIILEAGQNFYVPIGLRHQMYALEDSHLLSFRLNILIVTVTGSAAVINETTK